MRLLVIEDEPLIAQSLVDGLTGEGYAVDHADNGVDGLWMAQENGYDAIVLDILLPKMNGFKVCETLRANGSTTPILMLTAKDGEYDQAEGLDVGADDYLTKPFSFVVLTARLRALLRRGSVGTSAVLEVGDLSIDASRHVCRRGPADIALTPREFALLHYLMLNHDRCVTKRELIEHVWGDDELEANVIQVYIGYLRRKIDEPFDRSSIETVRGMGYRLVRSDG